MKLSLDNGTIKLNSFNVEKVTGNFIDFSENSFADQNEILVLSLEGKGLMKYLHVSELSDSYIFCFNTNNELLAIHVFNEPSVNHIILTQSKRLLLLPRSWISFDPNLVNAIDY